MRERRRTGRRTGHGIGRRAAAGLVALAALAGCSRRPLADAPAAVQTAVRPATPELDTETTAEFARDVQRKRLVDRLFVAELGREMIVRKVAYAGPDALIIPAYLFAPRDTTARHPVILFVHGGVHGDFGEAHLAQVRDLVRRGWVVVAPEYRGSTGYGARFFAAIDYGGAEVDDVLAARDWLARFAPWADLDRTVVMGYSHGGYIALLAALRRPELFRAAVAHVPVADLPIRMRTHPAWYQDVFAAQPAFGAPLDVDPRPYVDRSPTTHARALRTPVLSHVASNDRDVFIAENHALRDSMAAAGKIAAGLYHYREWTNPTGGHSFGVLLDTPAGRESWRETLDFLARHLAPEPTRGERARY